MARSLDGLLQLPLAVSPGELIEMQVLNPARTPADGRWVIAGSIAEEASDVPRIRVTLPPTLEPGDPVSVQYSRQGRVAVDVPEVPDLVITPSPPEPGSRPQITGTTAQAFVGRLLCVCGIFPDRAAWYGLLLDGEPVGPPAAASSRCIFVRLADSLEPGVHVIEGNPDAGFSSSDRIEFTALRLTGEIDRNALLRGESTEMRLLLEGTDRATPLKLINRTPAIVGLEGGAEQIAATSGGSPNRLERTVSALTPGDFLIGYELTLAPCRCADAALDEIVEVNSRPNRLAQGASVSVPPPPASPPEGASEKDDDDKEKEDKPKPPGGGGPVVEGDSDDDKPDEALACRLLVETLPGPIVGGLQYTGFQDLPPPLPAEGTQQRRIGRNVPLVLAATGTVEDTLQITCDSGLGPPAVQRIKLADNVQIRWRIVSVQVNEENESETFVPSERPGQILKERPRLQTHGRRDERVVTGGQVLFWPPRIRRPLEVNSAHGVDAIPVQVVTEIELTMSSFRGMRKRQVLTFTHEMLGPSAGHWNVDLKVSPPPEAEPEGGALPPPPDTQCRPAYAWQQEAELEGERFELQGGRHIPDGQTVLPSELVILHAVGRDRDKIAVACGSLNATSRSLSMTDRVTPQWEAPDGGVFPATGRPSASGTHVVWRAPSRPGTYRIVVQFRDSGLQYSDKPPPADVVRVTVQSPRPVVPWLPEPVLPWLGPRGVGRGVTREQLNWKEDYLEAVRRLFGRYAAYGFGRLVQIGSLSQAKELMARSDVTIMYQPEAVAKFDAVAVWLEGIRIEPDGDILTDTFLIGGLPENWKGDDEVTAWHEAMHALYTHRGKPPLEEHAPIYSMEASVRVWQSLGDLETELRKGGTASPIIVRASYERALQSWARALILALPDGSQQWADLEEYWIHWDPDPATGFVFPRLWDVWRYLTAPYTTSSGVTVYTPEQGAGGVDMRDLIPPFAEEQAYLRDLIDASRRAMRAGYGPPLN